MSVSVMLVPEIRQMNEEQYRKAKSSPEACAPTALRTIASCWTMDMTFASARSSFPIQFSANISAPPSCLPTKSCTPKSWRQTVGNAAAAAASSLLPNIPTPCTATSVPRIGCAEANARGRQETGVRSRKSTVQNTCNFRAFSAPNMGGNIITLKARKTALLFLCRAPVRDLFGPVQGRFFY